jgi:rod shape-determining protein MreC
MDTFFGRYKNPLMLAIALVAQFFLLAVQVRRPFPAAAAKVDQQGVRALRYGVASVVTPPESVLHKGGLSVRGIWSSYLDLIGVREENAKLRQEIDQLHMEQAALAEDARQGERLQDLLAFRQNYINATVPAQVVGTSGTDRSHVLLLDKGSDDGIAADMPVITPDGIVGRVRDVYPHTAQVLEISDPTSAAGVLLEETRTRGILRGSLQGQPQIVNLMPDDRIKPGQLVLTSGGDQIFPRGLPVGVVDHIAPDPDNEPMVNVVLKPAANLGRLEEVLVVTGTGPAPTERARRDVSKSELIAGGERAAKELEAKAATDDSQRASDVLAQRLPSRYDPADFYAPDATADSSPATSEAEAKPLHPPSALHPDHYTPGVVPAAESLTPGQRLAPLAEGTAATERRPAKTGEGGVNATDTAPVGTNPAFSSAVAAMAGERKAAADAKAADAARRYAATHPAAPVAPASTSDDATTAAATPSTATAPVRYIDRVNADGTTTRVAVPAAKPQVLYTKRVNEDGTVAWVPAPAGSVPGPVQYTNRTNADGTVTRVAVAATPGAPVLYIARMNADGTIAHVPATPLTLSAQSVHYVNRTNADGTVTRVAVPGPAPAANGVQYTTRTNADGTTTRVPVPATPTASGAPAVHYVSRTNADGTVTRVAVPGPAPAASGVQYTTRTNADGTTTRVPVPGTSAGVSTQAVHYVNRTNADGTVTRVAVPGTAGAATTAPAQRKTTPPVVTTRVVADGPLPAGSRTSSASASGSATKPNTTPKPATSTAQAGAASGSATARPAAPKRKTGPELVPDDGSRPPAKPAAAPAPNPQEQH